MVMKLSRLRIKNYRSLADLSLDFGGNSLFIIGECAIGKTSLLTAIARGLGREYGSFACADFTDVSEAIEILMTLTDLTNEQIGTFPDVFDFASRSLQVGVRVTWDADQQKAEAEHGYPHRDWRRSTREERDALAFHWLPADRDMSRMLQFGLRRNLLGRLLDNISIGPEVQTALQSIQAAGTQISGCESLQALLNSSRQTVSNIIPDVSPDLFSVAVSASTDLEVLRQLELGVSHHGNHIRLAQQSNGLVQIVGFAFLAELIRAEPDSLLLIDQPENSLHPQPQRALISSLQEVGCQMLVTTHSSNVLDRVDPRAILRLHRHDGTLRCARPSTLSDNEARRLARYTTPQTAEAFFAKAVILVEGLSDLFALVAAANTLGRNLNAEGIAIVSMEGAGGIDTFVKLLGPAGFQLKLAGLCDADKESLWANTLHAAGLCTHPTRAAVEDAGYFVCDPDLEGELLAALGARAVVDIIESQGEKAVFDRFALQPAQRTKNLEEQLHAFLAKRKVRYAPLLAERLGHGKIPAPLTGVLNHV
jgi:predicted ATPase